MDGLRGARWVSLVRFASERIGRRHVEGVLIRLARHYERLQRVPVEMADGRVLYLDLRNRISMPYLMQDDFEHERYEVDLLRQIVRPGDTVIDVGAGVGWYTSLLCEFVGEQGKVYAFEPNARLATLLQGLARHTPQLRVVAAGVGDFDGNRYFHMPEDQIEGTSGRARGMVAVDYVPMIRLDTFAESEEIDRVTLIRCNAVGAEWDILKGALNTLNRDRSPAWLMEISGEGASQTQTDRPPERLPEFFREQVKTEYKALMMNRQTGELEPLQIPTEGPFEFSVLFVPPWLETRLSEMPAYNPAAPSASPQKLEAAPEVGTGS
ncbi:MAG TPA: FkbM family methyltransferase [Chloroflexi bacterium]|nr:FkbM family methyltransferase [Chloroflexota bacterium]